MLTTHGRSALARWFVGSVVEGVVRATSVPVLVIPRQHSRRYAARVSELLAQAPLFAALSQEDRDHLGETARIRAYQPGDSSSAKAIRPRDVSSLPPDRSRS